MSWIIEYPFSTMTVAQCVGISATQAANAIKSGDLKESCFFLGTYVSVPNYHTFCDAVSFACRSSRSVHERISLTRLDEILDIIALSDERRDFAYVACIQHQSTLVFAEFVAELAEVPVSPDSPSEHRQWNLVKAVSSTWLSLYLQLYKVMEAEMRHYEIPVKLDA